MNGRDVGLRDAQVDVLGLHLELGADRGEVDLAIRRDLALLAHAGVELESERRTVEAVEVLQIEIQRRQVQRHRRGCALRSARCTW